MVGSFRLASAVEKEVDFVFKFKIVRVCSPLKTADSPASVVTVVPQPWRVNLVAVNEIIIRYADGERPVAGQIKICGVEAVVGIV